MSHDVRSAGQGLSPAGKRLAALPVMLLLAIATVCFGAPASATPSPMLAAPPASVAVASDTSAVRIVQPGAPGEPTQVLQERQPPPIRIVQPGAPGEPTQVLSRGARPASAPARIVYPGAPGEPSRVQRPMAALERSAGPQYTEADVAFMQDMIMHHAQAVQMTALVSDRAAGEEVRQLAQRIERSQDDEIAFMRRWLTRRGEQAPLLPPAMHDAANGDQAGHAEQEHAEQDHEAHQASHRAMEDHSDMAGMLSPDQLDALAAASGEAFDRLFLEFMIFHHEGAITMVDELFAAPNAGQETEMFDFASHVESDQAIEIARMQRLLTQLP
ncbi:MAG: DUF305 domain-containing protein [Bacteroidetes bacterium]|jgi:uncharacterized protein (DUF305 family)|nr:DUF305 domain-containing protein [Bacteroidota bacterium]